MEESAKTIEEGKPEVSRGRKIFNIVSSVVTWTVFAIALVVLVFSIISVATLDRADRNIFGYKSFVVLSDSMAATDFAAGDLIFVREVDPATLEEGDIITFKSTNNNSYGEIITHKIHLLTQDENGNPGFVTYGTTTGVDDEAIVTYQYVLGQYKGKIAGVGNFFQFLRSTTGYIICILVPFLLLIISQVVSVVRILIQRKNEQE